MTDATIEQSDKHDSGVKGLITALGIAQICSWGTLYYSFALMAEAMRVDLGWPKTEIYGAATIGLTLAGVAAYPVGVAIDRGQGRYVMSLASVGAGLLLVAWSQVSNLFVFYAIFAAMGCLQAATFYEPAFAVIARRVGSGNARRGITILTLWGGFASTVFIPLIQFLIDQVGWRDALMVLGAINIIVCGGLYFLAIDPTKDRPRPVREAHVPAPLEGRKAVAWAMRRPLLLERGLDSTGVVTVLAVIGPAQVAGRMLIMFFAPNAPVRKVGSIIVIVFPLAVVGFALAPANVLMIDVIAAFYGGANGMITIVRGLMVPEMISRDAYGAINGALVAPMNVTLAIAPLAAAWIWSTTGSYDAVLIAIGAGAMVLCAGFWTAASLSKPR